MKEVKILKKEIIMVLASITLKVEPELHYKFKQYCLNKRITMKQCLISFIQNKLKETT